MTSATSHLERMRQSINLLPQTGRDVIEALFVRGMSDKAACEALKISHEELAKRRRSALRSLMTAVR
jgi:DNA-directed RNA polymerase specialized sigma24 family protein